MQRFDRDMRLRRRRLDACRAFLIGLPPRGWGQVFRNIGHFAIDCRIHQYILLSLCVSRMSPNNPEPSGTNRDKAALALRKGGDAAVDPHLEWMTVAEAMAYLRVSRATLYRLMAERRLPYFTVGTTKDRRLRRQDLDAALLPQGQLGKKAA